ncbi:MAG TPA: hypothetical protein VID67_14510 [Rhizomicrobium sp.]|jgi:hypothetical protein
MTVAASGHRGIRRRSTASRVLAFFTVLAFALQSFIIQTHIHNGPQAAVATFSADAPAPHSKYPHNKAPADCPLCQAVAHTGAFLTPATIAMLLPVSVQTITLRLVVQTATADRTHGWQSRAPPR